MEGCAEHCLLMLSLLGGTQLNQCHLPKKVNDAKVAIVAATKGSAGASLSSVTTF
jgi:hypothetical protein